jgi:hypothetical protein
MFPLARNAAALVSAHSFDLARGVSPASSVPSMIDSLEVEVLYPA